MSHKPFAHGFTLLELMVVIAIISILASVSAPTFTRQITKAKLVEAQNLATQHQSLVEEYILLEGLFPTTTEFDQIKTTLNDDTIVKSISVSQQNDDTGHLIIALKKSTGIKENQNITYIRDSNKTWHCTSDINQNVLPQQCDSLEGEEE
ncbi:pilin [Marinomonas transparens]|uniref:Pilin n=1 Tax=Marinomonas transparens TaxID=2795388 RepID=A0A934JVT2_9GAMM|nr:pilin [Marinomonas transparens]MBJ7538129.1 pilin [Marinomonas transparens]